jgi:hypothetical protein
MSAKINVELIDICLDKRRIHSKEIVQKKNNQIKPDSSFFWNELEVAETIRKIRYHQLWFDIIQKHSLLKVGVMDERVLYQHEIAVSREIPKYILCEYPNERRFEFWDFIMNLPTPKLAVLHLFDSFSILSNSIDILHQNGLFFYGLTPDNIVFNESLKPVLRNFGNNCFSFEQTPLFIENICDLEYKPLDCHVLSYLLKNKCASLSLSIIEEICDNYLIKTNNTATRLECVEYLSRFINKPVSFITDELMKQCDKWDKISLAMVFLRVGEPRFPYDPSFLEFEHFQSFLTNNNHLL